MEKVGIWHPAAAERAAIIDSRGFLTAAAPAAAVVFLSPSLSLSLYLALNLISIISFGQGNVVSGGGGSGRGSESHLFSQIGGQRSIRRIDFLGSGAVSSLNNPHKLICKRIGFAGKHCTVQRMLRCTRHLHRNMHPHCYIVV